MCCLSQPACAVLLGQPEQTEVLLQDETSHNRPVKQASRWRAGAEAAGVMGSWAEAPGAPGLPRLQRKPLLREPVPASQFMRLAVQGGRQENNRPFLP